MLSPVMLELGVLPAVTASTASYMIVLETASFICTISDLFSFSLRLRL